MGVFMPAKRIDINEHPALKGAGAGKHERLLFNSANYHVWIHHSVPGDKGPMHKHTADQQFYCVQGQCTFHFGGAARQSCLALGRCRRSANCRVAGDCISVK